jgi:hypothetical protein
VKFAVNFPHLQWCKKTVLNFNETATKRCGHQRIKIFMRLVINLGGGSKFLCFYVALWQFPDTWLDFSVSCYEINEQDISEWVCYLQFC